MDIAKLKAEIAEYDQQKKRILVSLGMMLWMLLAMALHACAYTQPGTSRLAWTLLWLFEGAFFVTMLTISIRQIINWRKVRQQGKS